MFDLLTKPDPTSTATEEPRVKKVVKELLARLKTDLLVLDWKKAPDHPGCPASDRNRTRFGLAGGL